MGEDAVDTLHFGGIRDTHARTRTKHRHQTQANEEERGRHFTI